MLFGSVAFSTAYILSPALRGNTQLVSLWITHSPIQYASFEDLSCIILYSPPRPSIKTVLYLMYSRNDRVITKVIGTNSQHHQIKFLINPLAVHIIFLLDTIQSILTVEDTFFWFAYNFGDIDKIYQFHFASIDVPLIDAVVAFTVQMVYCWRIWVLSRWRVVPTLITLVHSASSFLFFGHLTKVALDCPPGRSIRSSCWNSNSEYRDLYECD